MNAITLNIELVNATLDYLGRQPYVQVAGIIQGIQAAAQESAARDAANIEAAAARAAYVARADYAEAAEGTAPGEAEATIAVPPEP